MSQPIRKIIHIDMDAFFASVEQRDNPDLRGKPVAVGGSRARGVVAAASYEARKYGVHSALASKIAAQRCPQLIFVKARFDVYSSVSRQIREIFHMYTDLVEPLSLDEAYLDVTENKIGMPSATIIANQIRQRIFEETGLTASAGVSYNKFLAKIASDMNKPNGFTLITPDKAEELVASLDIGKFHGIGKVTAAKMQSMGILTGADLRERSEEELVRHFGKTGRYYYRIARAQDERDVQPHRIRKSIGSERTFETDLAEEATIKDFREVMETNFFGALQVTQAVLPYMRRQGSGHIIQMSSVAGFRSTQGFGVYNASKFALEGMSEALAQEVVPLGIKVTIVEPGPFRTNFAGSSIKSAKQEMPEYEGTARVFKNNILGYAGQQEGDPQKAAQVILQVVNSDDPPLRLPLGNTAFTAVRNKLQQVAQDLENWEEVAANTSFSE